MHIFVGSLVHSLVCQLHSLGFHERYSTSPIIVKFGWDEYSASVTNLTVNFTRGQRSKFNIKTAAQLLRHSPYLAADRNNFWQDKIQDGSRLPEVSTAFTSCKCNNGSIKITINQSEHKSRNQRETSSTSGIFNQGAYKFGKMKFPEFCRFSTPSRQSFPDNYKAKTPMQRINSAVISADFL